MSAYRQPLLVLACLICSLLATAAATEVPPVDVMRVPNGGVHPQAQTDSRGRVHLIYFKGDPKHGDIFYVRGDDAGAANFTAPIRVNSQPGSAMIIGTVRGPHLAIGKDDRVHVAWAGSDRAEPKIGGKKPPMLYTRLDPTGTAFEPQRNVDQRHPGLDGGAIAADREGNVYVAWHAPTDTDNADEANRQVWVARSRDNGATFDPETAAVPESTGVCGCCGLSIAAGDHGVVAVVFRSASEKVNRNIHLLLSNDYGKTFRIAAVDPWRVGICVMSTASIAVREKRIVATWETQEQIRGATLNTDTGRIEENFAVPGAGKGRKHPSVAIDTNGQFVVAWTEGTGWERGGALAWQLFDGNARPFPNRSGSARDLPTWDVPAAFVAHGGTLKIIY
jgi:hypothetical protein